MMRSPNANDSIYYDHAGRIGLFRRISLHARLHVFRLFLREMQPGPASSILDLGVSLDVGNMEANVLEQFYPYRNRITAAGIGDGAAVEAAYPWLRFIQIQPNALLPFADNQFDVGYCNAVVEHVGSRQEQRKFLAELCRVSKRVFVVVPNRLFPIEHHTGLPLVHYLPLPVFRRLMRDLPFTYWAEEANLNPLFPKQFRSLFPDHRSIRMCYAGLGFSICKSNIVAIG
jgi:SAM-dependent methyltransferase